jgi:adhesin/invasin
VPGAQPVTYTSAIAFAQGNNWLTVQPASGSIASNQAAQLSFQTNVNGLPAGVYPATVTLTFSGGGSRRIDVLLIVSTGASQSIASSGPRASGCIPTRLNPVFTLLGFGFSAAAAWPVSLEAKIVDDCGQPMVNGDVTATFTNNDPALSFSSLHDGRWSATWSPRTATQVGIALAAQTTAPALKGSVAITGVLTPNPDPPQVASGGVLNAASYVLQAPVAPGALVSIFGAKLTQANGSAAALPLVSQMNGTEVTIAGRRLPLLFTSDGQVNAMLPYDLPGNAALPLIVQRGNSLSIPELVPISASQPAIFTKDLSGKGQGIVLGVNADGSQYFAEPESPASAGAVLVIYCAGLGTVQPTVGAGLPAPFSPLSVTSNPVTVNIGGVNAPVLFAGLTPGFTGLYQVNAVVPTGIAPGSAVPITLSVSGQTSPGNVTIAVQ